MTKLNFQDH